MDHISFIIYKTDESAYERLINSLANLNIPEGISADVITVTGESSKAEAYNCGMSRTSAKYKIYVDENVTFNNENLLADVVAIFQKDAQIGIIGVCGTEVLPTSGIAYMAKRRVGKMNYDGRDIQWKSVNGQYEAVCSVDGFFFATQYDVSWRDDLFCTDAYLDTSQCLEFKKNGYLAVVAAQEKSWCTNHGININFDSNSKENFLNEYSSVLYPKVLVMIPTFNRPGYFKIALESALNQTYRNLEIVVSDDSTNDLTKELIQEYLLDSRLKYYRHEGFSAKDNWDWMRQYVKDSQCEYINWLMDDDIFHVEKISKMMDFYLENDDIALVTSHRQTIDANGEYLSDIGATEKICKETTVFDGEAVGRNILCRVCNFVGEPTTVLIKKMYLKDGDFGWNDLEGDYTAEDYPTWLHILEHGNMVYIPETLSYFRRHEGQWQNNIGIQVRSALCWIIDIQYAFSRKIYLKTIDDYKVAVFNVMKLALFGLERAFMIGVQNEDTDLLLKKLIELLNDLKEYAGKDGTCKNDSSVLWGRFR